MFSEMDELKNFLNKFLPKQSSIPKEEKNGIAYVYNALNQIFYFYFKQTLLPKEMRDLLDSTYLSKNVRNNESYGVIIKGEQHKLSDGRVFYGFSSEDLLLLRNTTRPIPTHTGADKKERIEKLINEIKVYLQNYPQV